MQDLRDELEKMVDEAEWDWLIPHAQRDAIVLVDPALDLVDVGVAFANDHVSTVQEWIVAGKIQKPSQQQLSDWGQERSRRFNALIVQPYVLIQHP